MKLQNEKDFIGGRGYNLVVGFHEARVWQWGWIRIPRERTGGHRRHKPTIRLRRVRPARGPLLNFPGWQRRQRDRVHRDLLPLRADPARDLPEHGQILPRWLVPFALRYQTGHHPKIHYELNLELLHEANPNLTQAPDPRPTPKNSQPRNPNLLHHRLPLLRRFNPRTPTIHPNPRGVRDCQTAKSHGAA